MEEPAKPLDHFRKACPLHGTELLRYCHIRMYIQKPLDLTPLMDVCEEITCSLSVDLSSLPSDIRGTSQHLASRHPELRKWQSLTVLSTDHVEREVDALEQLKLNVADQLDELQTYANFISECVKSKEDLYQFVRDDVYAELKKEQQLTNDISEMLKNHTFLLHGQIDSLRSIQNTLLMDFQDKSQAITLTANCMMHSNLQESPQTEPKKCHISYDEWKSKFNKLQNTTDNLLKKSSNLRRNVELTLKNLKNAYTRQQSSTSKAMRKIIHDMKKREEQMRWKLKQAVNEMDDLMKTLQRGTTQMRLCIARTIENGNNLDTLNQQQPRDQAHNSLTLQRCDLTLIVTGQETKIQVHTKMEAVRRRILVLQGELEAQGRALQTELKCQDMYKNILPLHGASVGPMNNGTGAVNFLERLQQSHG